MAVRVPVTRSEPTANRSLQQWPLLVVVVGVLAGIAITLLGDLTWRLGCVVVGMSLLVGAAERLVLPRRAAGLLEVRGRAFDVIVLAVGGLAVLVLAMAVPGGR